MPRVDTDEFYRNALARYGENAEGAHWHSTEMQQLRFKVLRQLLPARLDDLTLVDVGCGLGDFHTFLAEQDALPRRYIGIDVVEPMVRIARARTRCRILQADALTDPLPAADYYVCSGAMNLLTRDETHRFIERCLGASRAGLVFNLLKGRNHSRTFNFMLPDDIRDLAATLGAGVEIVEDYLAGDFSAILTPPDKRSATPE
jgi:SAM-dependent methyltransferase